MHQLVPQFILQQLAAGHSSGSFSGASLFIDISGFSHITDALMEHGEHGAEVLAGLMTDVFEPLLASVYAQRGFVATISGDGLLVLFVDETGDAPAVHRALAAAKKGQERLALVGEPTTPYGSFALPMKAGIAVGDVEWCIVESGDQRRAGYYFRGTAVDLGAEAEKRAAAGEIVLTAPAYERVDTLVSAESVDRHFRVRNVTGALPTERPVDPPAVDAALLGRFFPQELLTQSHQGEFRHVVSVFVGLPTARAQEQMRIFLRQLFALQDRYGGLFSRLSFGDKGPHMLLFWGAPVAYENDIERALNLVLDLQENSAIPINAGITYTIAYAGFSGSRLRQDYTVYGRGINLASRFMSAAPRGEIWVDENVAKRAERLFEFAFEGARQFKGFSSPQKVFALIERKEAAHEPDIREMVGRAGELEQLFDFVRPVFAGQCAGITLVRGDAGIGKSVLIQKLASSLRSNDTSVLWAFCQSDEILRESLNPFVYWLKRHFGQTEKQSQARNKRSFNRRLDRLIAATEEDRLAAELDRVRSFLGALVELYWSDSLYEQLDAQGRYENTMQGLLSLFQAECRRQPLVLILEDAQWLDDDSREFLARLHRLLSLEQQQPYPVAIVATARPTSRPALGDGVTHEEIWLGELTRESQRELARDHLGGEATAALLDLLEEHAQGNPFYAVQILLYLRERNLLTAGEEGWEFTRSQDAPLPPDVRALLVARLDALARQVREAVQTASVLGREFDLQVLDRVLTMAQSNSLGPQLSQTLVTLVDSAERAAIWSALTEMRYIFRHALLRDAAYSMQLRRRLQALHALAATSLEAVYEDAENVPYAELGYHCEKGGMVDKARHYLKLAGDKAMEAFQNAVALQYYGRSLNLTANEDVEFRFQLLMARAKVLHLSGERDAQRLDLDALLRLAATLGDAHAAQVKVEEARLEGAIGNVEEAIAAVRDAAALAGEAGVDSVLATSYLLWGWYLYRQSDFTAARSRYEQARAHAKAAQMPAEEANSLNGLAILAMEEGDSARSRSFYDEARALYREAGRLEGEGNILNNLSVLASRQGQLAEARRFAKEALALRNQIGDRKGEGNTANNLAEFCRGLGHYEEAERYYDLSLRIRREVGDRRGEAFMMISLAILATDFGDFDRARQLNDRALAIVRELGDRMLEGAALMNQGSAATHAGDLDGGLHLSLKAVTLLRQVDNRYFLGHALRGLGAALFLKKRFNDALDAYREAAELAAELDPRLLAQAEAGMAEVFWAQGELASAMVHVEGALKYLQSLPMRELEEPFSIAIICYRVLASRGDPRAPELLQSAYNALLERAARISDPARREAYLRKVPAHAEIVSTSEAGPTN